MSAATYGSVKCSRSTDTSTPYAYAASPNDAFEQKHICACLYSDTFHLETAHCESLFSALP